MNVTKVLGIVLFALVLSQNFYGLGFTGDSVFDTTCSIPTMPVFTLTNTTSKTQTIKIISEGDYKEWIIIGDKKIGTDAFYTTLAKGESQKIYAFIKPNNCYVKEGTYYITLKISDSEKTITKILTVKVKESLKLEISGASNTYVNQCQSKDLTFRIFNDGVREERIIFSLSSDFSQEEKELIVSKGETEVYISKITIPCSTEPKTYTITAKARIDAYDFSEEKNFSITIGKTEDISVYNLTGNVCIENPNYSIKIKNNSNYPNEINLELDGKGKDISLGARQTLDVLLPLESSFEGIGTKLYKLILKSKTFGTQKEYDLKLNLNECYSFSIEPLNYSGIYEYCEGDLKEFKFVVKNTGKENSNFKLESNAKLSEYVFSLNKGQSKTISGVLEVSGNINVKVESEGNIEEKEFLVDSSSCYSLEVNYPSDLEIEKACDTQSYAIAFKNTGKKNQKILVSAEGPNWAYLKPQELSLSSLEEGKVFVYLSPSADELSGLYFLKINIQAENFSDSKEIKITLFGSVKENELLVSEKSSDLITETYGTLNTKFNLENTGKGVIRISDLKILNYTGTVSPSSFDLEINEKKTVDIKVDFGTSIPSESVILELSFLGNNEPITKEILVKFSEDLKTEEVSEIISESNSENEGIGVSEIFDESIIPIVSDEENSEENISEDIKVTGAFSLGGIERYALVIVIILVLGAIAYFYLKDDSSGKKEEPKKVSQKKKEEEFVKEMEKITEGEFS